MELIVLLFVIVALVCFGMATFNAAARVNLVAGGLALLTFAYLLTGIQNVRVDL